MTKSDQICTFVQWYRILSLYKFTNLVRDRGFVLSSIKRTISVDTGYTFFTSCQNPADESRWRMQMKQIILNLAHAHFKKMSFGTFLVVIVSVLLHSRIFRGNFVGLLQGTESYVPWITHSIRDSKILGFDLKCPQYGKLTPFERAWNKLQSPWDP